MRKDVKVAVKSVSFFRVFLEKKTRYTRELLGQYAKILIPRNLEFRHVSYEHFQIHIPAHLWLGIIIKRMFKQIYLIFQETITYRVNVTVPYLSELAPWAPLSSPKRLDLPFPGSIALLKLCHPTGTSKSNKDKESATLYLREKNFNGTAVFMNI